MIKFSSEDNREAMIKAFELFGICMAAGYFVPKFCNLGMPPIMKKLMPNYDPNANSDSTPTALAVKKTEAQVVNRLSVSTKSTGPRSLNYYSTIGTNLPYYRAEMRV